MDARIESRGTILLAGMGFFGDPIANSGAWDEDNEIGALWKRFMAFLASNPKAPLEGADKSACWFEVHIRSPEREKTGRYEVFVGIELPSASALPELPCSLSAKALPAVEYAALTLRGEEISSDWAMRLYAEIIPSLGRVADEAFSFERYDSRFKGMDRLAESELEVWVPLIPGEKA